MAGLSGAVVPILAIIAAVVTLISIGSYLKDHWSEIKDFFYKSLGRDKNLLFRNMDGY